MSEPNLDVESIFLAALEHGAPDDRARYVNHACGGDEAVRQHVERLIQAHERAGGDRRAEDALPIPRGTK